MSGSATQLALTPEHWSVRWTYNLRYPAALLCTVLLGGVVVYTANAAVPGEALYPVKTAVLEPMLGAMYRGETGPATWSVMLLQRRVDEVVALQGASVSGERVDDVTQAVGQLQPHIDQVITATRALPVDADPKIRDHAWRAIAAGKEIINAHYSPVQK
jgi:hypothetical protein